MNGTGSTADHVAHQRYHRPQPDAGPLFGWGRELARRGYAMLTFTPKGAETRRITLGRWEEENRRLIPYGRSQIGVIADEVLRAARVLGAQEGVDANRIGLAGMSLGGWATWLGMALGDWIRTGASVCGGLGSLRINIHDGMPERHSSFAYLPHMLRYFEHWDIVNGCIAPRPFMMLAPTEDEDMPKAGVDRLIREVEPVYAAAGKPDHFKVVPAAGPARLQAGVLRAGLPVVRPFPWDFRHPMTVGAPLVEALRRRIVHLPGGCSADRAGRDSGTISGGRGFAEGRATTQGSPLRGGRRGRRGWCQLSITSPQSPGGHAGGPPVRDFLESSQSRNSQCQYISGAPIRPVP